jgi:hypothetical protein
MNPWLISSLFLLGIWFLIFIFRKDLRKEMLIVSIVTMPFGLTEPFFIPEYWNPPSLFNIAARTGFDIEALIFMFAVGGIVTVLYEFIFKVRHQKTDNKLHRRRNKYHLLTLISPFIIFPPLYLFTGMNPIYSMSIAVFIGGIAGIICRPDLKKKVFITSILFTFLYFISFLIFNFANPRLVQEVWNLEALSGMLILGVPLEELMFAFTFGLLWAGYYEHIRGYKLKSIRK